MTTTMKYEHTTCILNFEKKSGFSASRSGVLEGLSPESANHLAELGAEGWELVSVLPYSSGRAVIFGTPGTDNAIGFFKRAA